MKSTIRPGVALIATFAFAICAWSQTITAEYTNWSHGNSYAEYGQAETFAANIPGNLFDVSLYLIRAPADTSPVVVDFTSTSRGSPDAVLASATLQPSQIPTNSSAYVTVDFSGTNVQLAQGTLYAVTLRESMPMPSQGVYNWGTGTTAGSPGEQALYQDSSGIWNTVSNPTPANFVFIARVQTVPEPSSFLLLLAGFLFFVARPRRAALKG